MNIRDRLITGAIVSAIVGLFIASPVQSQTDYERELTRAVERNQMEMRLRLERELATPARSEPQYFYSPQGQPLGYIQQERGETNMFGVDGQWIGTVPGGR